VAELGPEERQLFESSATPLYEEAALAGGLRDSDPRLGRGGELRPALDLLLALNLLVHDREAGAYRPVDPSTVQSHLVAPMSQRGADLLTESSEWARAFGALSQSWRRSPGAVRGPISEFHSHAIGVFITGAVAECEEELLTAQPQTGRERASLKAALTRDRAALDRGVKMRTLYQHSARRHAATRDYVAQVSELGAEVRTLDEFFNRMIVVDRRLATIPGPGGDDDVAIAVQEPALVAYLVDVFERAWERARPFSNSERSMTNDVARQQRAMTIRMLTEGHSDPVSAKRLGVSARTFAGYVADLKAEYEADTRFQLGYAMGKAGVSGREED
jgi:sugar-specific transcriptional regulator TrmB